MTDQKTTPRGAKAILRQMMREIARDDIPAPETWRAACRCVGWPEPPNLPSMRALSFQELMEMTTPKEFRP